MTANLPKKVGLRSFLWYNTAIQGGYFYADPAIY